MSYSSFFCSNYSVLLIVVKFNLIVLSKIDENRCKQTLASLP